MATERYLLGEMSGPELDDFEEHMFVCAECAEAVRRGAAFTENARAVFHEHPNLLEEGKPRATAKHNPALFFWKWLSFPQLATSFAALALLCVVGYQQKEINKMRAPQAISEYVLTGTARGAETTSIPAGAGPLAIELDGLPKKCMNGCTALFRGSAFPFKTAQDRTAHLLLPRAAATPGDYTIVIQTGTTRAETVEEEQYPFQVR